jgi:hypothetical protein
MFTMWTKLSSILCWIYKNGLFRLLNYLSTWTDFSFPKYFSIKVGVVLIVLYVNVVEKLATKENFYYVMIVISPTIRIV